MPSPKLASAAGIAPSWPAAQPPAAQAHPKSEAVLPSMTWK